MIDRRGLLSGLGLAAIGALAPARLLAAPLDSVLASGVLRVAVYRDFQPWSWRRDGVLVGIDVDLGLEIARRIGVKVDYLELAAGEDVDEDLRTAVWRGSLLGMAPADIMLHVPYDREFALRNDRVAIVAPYFRESFAMACNGETTDCEVPPAQLKGKRLAAELDSIPDFYLSGSFGGVLRADVRHVVSGSAAVNAVIDGSADAAVATRAQVENALHDSPGHATERKGPLPAMMSPGWDVAIAVKDNSRDLGDRVEAIMAELVDSDAFKAIFAAYGVTYRPAISG
ncbi:MAG: ABC transporter substrate-binding protein [Sphingomonas sp. SCN 67-18]|uniref:substrate-binding periplasmic protein n=1 Tax=uncultured Sphingomonas sp. TaxID=158754 RepID=UPI0008694F41|nr:transporter substrate-binding domain-containing protein [Sphingomonas sp. SCN 67-18]ODU20000.1 MAG: ABC transporter substrate-binding protein [Sphingomonas sp. SCN 67-18]